MSRRGGRCRGAARAVEHAVPGVGVAGLCAAVVTALVVPAVLSPQRSSPPRSSHVAAQPHMALATSSTSGSTTLPPECTTQSSSTVVTCTYASSNTHFTEVTKQLKIPSGITKVAVQVWGAIGGGTASPSYSHHAGFGALVTGTLDISAIANSYSSTWNRTLAITAGANGRGNSGKLGGAGGSPGGGAGAGGHGGGGGGGGWTAIQTTTGFAVVVAGAGGGTGGYGTSTPSTGATPAAGGSGGKTGTGGADGSGEYCFIKSNPAGRGGHGATQSSAGGGGSGQQCSAGTGGTAGSTQDGGKGGGGNGASGSGGGGGGGGGGWYGGGGGGGGGTDGSAGGGGGGSSWAHPVWVTNITYHTPGASSGWATVQLSWIVQKTTTSLVVTGSSTPKAGQSVTLKATVTSASSVVDMGSVDFDEIVQQAFPPFGEITVPIPVTGCSGATAKPVIDGSAKCTFRTPGTSSHPIAGHRYVATYAKNLAYQTSRSSPVTLTTQPDVTTIGAVTVTSNNGVYLHARVVPPSYAPTKITTATVVFSWASTDTSSANWAQACSPKKFSAPAAAAVTVTCRFDTVVPGTTYWFKASFSGQGENAPAASTPGTYHVNPFTPSVSLVTLPRDVSTPTYGQGITLEAQVTGLPTRDSHPGTVRFETATTRAPITCIGPGEQNPVHGTNVNGTFSVECVFQPGANGSRSAQAVRAAYNGDHGDPQTTTTTSPTLNFTVKRGTATIALSVVPIPTPVGAQPALRATVTDTTWPTAPIEGVVQFEEDGNVVCTTTAVYSRTARAGVATCGSVTAPTTLSKLTFSATYCPTATTSCRDWNPATSAAVGDTTAKDPTQVVLIPVATQANPQTVPGGTAVTVTATVSTTLGHQAITGTITFTENGGPITSCPAASVGSSGTASCRFVPVEGNEDTVVASYTPKRGSLTGGSSSARWYVKASAAKTTTTLIVPASATYGAPVTARASVTSKGVPVPSGTVAFSVDGSPIPSCGAQPVDKTGGATCALPPSLLPVGQVDVSASFGYAGGTFAKSASPVATVTIGAAPTSAAASVGPTSSSTDLLAVTVTNDASGAIVPPAGAVTVTAGGSVVCTRVTLAPSAGSMSVATCSVPRPTATATYVAAFTPTGTPADFTGSTAPTVSVTPGGACTTSTFTAVWGLAGKSLTLSVGGGASVGSVGVTLGAVSGPCIDTGIVPFTGASVDLFGKTLAGASVSGYVRGAQGAEKDPQVCLSGGSLGLPSGWSIGSVTLSATAGICFALINVGTSTGTLGSPAGSLSGSGVGLPFGFPATSATYTVTLGFTVSPVPALTVHVAPSIPPTGSPFATLTVTVEKSGSSFVATGSLRVDGLPFLGAPVDSTFQVAAGTSSTFAGNITFSIPSTASYSPVPGVTLETLKLALSTSTGLTLTGKALIGMSGNQVTIGLSGGYTHKTGAHKWFLKANGAAVKSWEPFSTTRLVVNASLSGVLEITTAGASAAVSYDFEAGTPPTNHTGGKPIVIWSPGNGVTADLDCIAFAFGITPACSAGSTASNPTDPTLFAQGSVAFGTTGGSGGIRAGFKGAFDLKNHAVDLSYDATAGPVSATPVSGLILTLTSLTVSGHGATLDVTGGASAAVAALGTTVTVSFSYAAKTLVVAGSASFKSTGVPLTGLLVYASNAVTTYTTAVSTIGKVNLSQGFSGFAVYHPTSQVLSVLHEVDAGLGTGAGVVFTAHWAPGGSPSFSLALSGGTGFPFLSLPDTGSITTATLAYAATTLSLAVAGTIPVPGSNPAGITLTATIGTGGAAGTFTGTATVATLVVFGQNVGLTGNLSRSATGKITATIASCQPKSGTCTKGPIPGPLTPFPGVPLQLSTVSFSLGTAGIAVAATMSVDGLGSLAVTGSLQKLQTWSLAVAASLAQRWSPAPGVTLSPSFVGTVTDAFGSVTFSLQASGASGSPLFSLSPGPVMFSVASVGLGNAAPPSGCRVTAVGDLWLVAAGTVGMSLGSVDGNATAAGCFDLTTKRFALSATVTSLKFTALTGHVMLAAPTVTISGSSGSYQVAAKATLTVIMPTGGSLVVRATIDFESGGDFVIGAEVNLSQWLGTDGDAAYLYYSSKAVGSFDTGDPTLGKIALVRGVTFGVAISLPTSVVTGLDHVGIHLPAHTGFAAVGSITFSSEIFRLKVSVSLGSGLQIFTAGGVKLLLDSGFLQVVLSPSVVEFGVGLSATLHLPSVGAGGRASTVRLTGQLTVSDTDVAVTLSLGSCGATTTAWFTAFGIPGLTVRCAALTGDVTYEFPFVSVGFSGTITSLPSVISEVTGYQGGAPITFAFNLDPLLLSLSIGTKGSTTPALEPLAVFGQGTLIKVDYASLYIAPEGATIGSTVYPAGISMGFQATLFSVRTSILASIGLSPPSITFTATVSKITLYGLSIGPVSVVLAASAGAHPTFEFQSTGTASLGPGSVDLGPTLKVGGGLSASVQVTLSTKGLSAFIWGSASLTVAAWVATATCYTQTIWPYPCRYQWETTGFSVTLTRTGFSITSSGVTLEADGYKVTFDYDGRVSASLANVQWGHGRRSGSARVVGRRPVGELPMALAATRQQLTNTPKKTPVPPPTGPRLTGGKAVLVPTTSVVQPATSPSSSTVGSGGGPGSTPVTVRPVTGPAVGSWQPTTPMASARAFPATATLRNGDVLVAGGAGGSKQPLASAEVYDPATGKWSPVRSLSTARVGATATVLKDGDVLIAGGFGATRRPLETAELFDPTTGSFSRTGALHTARAFASSQLLPDGDVLVAGGVGTGHTPLDTAELYDPKSGTFSATGSMQTAHAFGAVAGLADGQVLVAGGQDATGPLATAERYDPSSGTWSPAGKMTEPRAMASAATLPDGDVLVVGAAGDGDVYRPSTGTWKQTQGMPVPLTMPVVAALPGGRVLVAGGESMGRSVATAVLYQPSSRSWQSAGSMPAATTGAVAAALSNGQVLVAGGGNVTANPAGHPSITTEATAALYSPPAGSGARPGTRPSGAAMAVVSSSPLPIALGSAGGTVVLAGLAFWVYERRRRLRVRPVVVRSEGRPEH